MRSPLLVPLVLLSLSLLATVGSSQHRPKTTHHRPIGKVSATSKQSVAERGSAAMVQREQKRVPSFGDEVTVVRDGRVPYEEKDRRVSGVGDEVRQHKRVPSFGDDVTDEVRQDKRVPSFGDDVTDEVRQDKRVPSFDDDVTDEVRQHKRVPSFGDDVSDEVRQDKRVPSFGDDVSDEVRQDKRVPSFGDDVTDEVRQDKRVPSFGDEVAADVFHVKDEKVLQAVESNLLSLFGLKRRPRPARHVVIPEAMKELYRRQTGMDVDTTNLPLPGRHTGSANTVRTFTHKESPADREFRHQHRFRLSFPVDSIPKSEQLHSAELQLSAHGAHHILVHDIVQPGVRGQSRPATRLIDSRRIHAADGRITVDVTPAVQRWRRQPTENHGLLIVVQDGSGHVRLRRSVEEPEEWRKVQPILLTYTDDGRQGHSVPLDKRAKRAVRKNKRKEQRDLCRRHEMYVDFMEVGWNDWIVAPPGYDAYYCAGDCPFPQADHLNSTNHAIVQTLVNSVFPSSTPKACCVPTALASISMLYVDDEEKVVLKNYQDMSVVGCGCR